MIQFIAKLEPEHHNLVMADVSLLYGDGPSCAQRNVSLFPGNNNCKLCVGGSGLGGTTVKLFARFMMQQAMHRYGGQCDVRA